MIINLTMNEDKSITITNISTERVFKINYDDKIITAQDIYEMLSYEPNNIYKIKSNIDDINEENDKNYFSDVVNLINSIIIEINKMTEFESNNSSNESTSIVEEEILEKITE